MSQISFSDAEQAGKRKKTRREIFLAEMELVVPWRALLKVIEPHYPVAGRGRRPYPLEAMLRVHLMPGETVSTVMPRPVISLADLSRLRVRTEVDERDLGRLRIGQSVTVFSDAFPDKQFAGRVASFGSLMGRKQVRTGDPAEKSDRDVLEVLVELDERDERLVVGLRTTVRFLAQ